MQAIVARHIFSFIFSFLFSWYLIPIIAKAALKFDVLDVPDGRIKTHKKPVPYLGGLAMFLPFIATLSLAYPFENRILWLLLGTTFLLFLGLVDDLKVLQPGQKFLGQILAVLCFLKGGFALKANFFYSSFINMFLSGFWMLSLINAFNLIDVMDGLASVVAIVATLAFFIIAILFKQYAISLLLVSFCGPLFAFLYYNRPPARIYMGDSGAMFIGGFLAAIPLLFSWSSQSIDAYYVPVIILAIPLIEVFSLVVIRTYLGIPFFRGSPHHFAIYLQKKGWSKVQVLFFTLTMGIVLALVASAFLLNFISELVMFSLCGLFLLVWCYFIFNPTKAYAAVPAPEDQGQKQMQPARIFAEQQLEPEAGLAFSEKDKKPKKRSNKQQKTI